MAKNWKELKYDITAKELEYTDKFFEFKAEAKITQDSFAFNMYPAMAEAIDIKTNNYSNLVLSKSQLNSDWVDLDIKKLDYTNGLVTTMGFFAHNEESTDTPYYLYFDKNYEFWDMYLKHAPYSLVAGEPGTNHGNYTFYIEFIDDIRCKIRHWFGDLVFYFSVDTDKTIQFLAERDERNDFIYNIDGNKLVLYKKVNYTEKVVNKYTASQTVPEDPEKAEDTKFYDYVAYKVSFSSSSDIETLMSYNIKESLQPIGRISGSGAVCFDDFKNLKIRDDSYTLVTNPSEILSSTNSEYYVDLGIWKKDGEYYRDVNLLAVKTTYVEGVPSYERTIVSRVIKIEDSITNPNQWLKNYILISRSNTFLATAISKAQFEDNTKGDIIFINEEEARVAVYKIKAVADPLSENATIELSEDLSSDDASIITVNGIGNTIDFNPNSAYVKYDKSVSVNSIDTYYSQFNLKNQVLFHHEYNTDNSINFVPLKNHLTYKGSSIRGNNTSVSAFKYPEVDFRKYNAINSGINQETGYDNIILSYTFEDQEYVVNPGEDLFIYIDNENPETGIYPLYPYRYLNLADTKFIKNGAFGSDVPYFADKIKKLQANTTLTTQNYKVENGKVIIVKNDDPAYENTATYLCTWLYKKDAESDPVWLDRYYYPDLLSKQKAMRKPYVDPETGKEEKSTVSKTLGSIIDKNYIDLESHLEDPAALENAEIQDIVRGGKDTKKTIIENTFIDKISDMVIEPGTSYKFSHLSKEMVDEVLNEISNDSITTVYNRYGNPENIEDYINFNAVDYRRIDYSAWQKTNAINLNMDLYIEPKKYMGVQILGTDYCSGFNIQNRKDVTPLHYYCSDTTVYLLDDNAEVNRTFGLYKKYKEKIKRMVLGDVFDDLVLMTDEALYFLSYDLKVKSRVEYIDLYYQTGYMPQWFEDNMQNHIIAEKLCTYSPIFYKNNLYIPYIQGIAKVILVPENDIDTELNDIRLSLHPEKVAAVRLLNSDEYYVTYNKEDESDDSMERIDATPDDEAYDGIENGFINVKRLVKHIYIDKEGYIYGLNFDKYAVAPDNDTIYGLYNSEEDKAQGGWSWIFNVRLSKVRARLGTAKYAEFGSPNSIDDVKFNMNGEMALIRNFSNTIANTNSDNNKRLEIYDRSKRLIYTHKLEDYTDIYALDSYNYISYSGEERTVFGITANRALNSENSTIYKIEYISGNGSIGKIETTYISDVKEKPVIPGFYETINSNAIMRYFDTNKIYFNLYLPTVNMYNTALTIEWDIADLQSGWYNINVAIDLKKAIFEVRINDAKFAEINSDNNKLFIKNVNADGVIFNTSYYIGCIGKQYGTTLNDVLSSNIYDTYICKNCRIENMTIYTRTLDYHEYQAVRLKNKPLYPLSLTLPCGTRNNLEEIVRYFRYTYPGSVSNKVKINISGTGLTNEGEFDILRTEILKALQAEVDCLVDINDIEFI